MKPFLTLVLIILLVSACAPKTQEAVATPVRKLEKGETLFINTSLNLRTFPRSVIYSMAEDKHKTSYAFSTPLMIYSVFDNYHYQLLGNGWTQESLRKWGDSDYEATYSKSSERLRVRLRLEADRYIFETN
jgi:hypothetical protein